MPSFNLRGGSFATSLKHKRQEFSVSDLIGSLDVEEKARAKDTRARVAEVGSAAHMVQKKNYQSNKPKFNKKKSEAKGKPDSKFNSSHSTNFKKKKGAYHVCGDPNHWAPRCPKRHELQQLENSGKTANVVIGDT